MADTLILNIKLNGAEGALATLQQLDAATKSMRQPLTIKFNGTAVASRNMEKLAASSEKAATAIQKINGTAMGGGGNGVGMAGIASNAAAATKQVGLLGSAFSKLGKMAAWQIGGNLVSAMLGSVKTALSDIKEVDKELAVVQKVTGRTREEMKKLGDTAYDTASKYGVAASEYLESVGSFARAGYDEAAEGLGELAIKTQLVGDVSAEVADKFLLSVDAAYKYGGSIAELSAVLDKANAVENNYATSIEKIAEGMPIVASVAKTANMSIEETIAMLGTITATTQESGTKAATAARALILNIMGDTKTEIEDGVTLTSEQIKGLSDILWKYSADAMKAAQATGKIVDPMEAIAGLAKASQEGLLTEQELATIASSIGGKLRTNQLLALINNFDTFNDMLATMADSAGSADAEVGVMLDTWDAKAKQVKNSWTELWSTIADTDTIKSALDGINSLLNDTTNAINGQNKIFETAWKYIREEGMTVEGAYIKAAAEVQGLKDEVTGLPDYAAVDITTPGAQEAIERLKEIQNLSQDKTFSVSAIFSTSGTGGGYSQFGGWSSDVRRFTTGAHAGGTAYSPGGPTLVNELGPELISANGLAYIAGGGRPTITNLPRGAIVLTAEQTRQAVGGAIPAAASGISATGVIGGPSASDLQAYRASQQKQAEEQDKTEAWMAKEREKQRKIAEAQRAEQEAQRRRAAALSAENEARVAQTAMLEHAGEIDPSRGMAMWAAAMDAREDWLYGSKGDDTGGGGGGGRGGAAKVDLKQSQKDLDDWLKNLKLQAELADNQGEHRREGDLYGQAEGKIRQMIALYKAQGYADTADEVLTLENLIYDYAEKQQKAYQHTWDEMEDALDKALDNINAQIDKAESENDVVKQMELYGEAQDKIGELLNAYLAAGYSPTSDEVLRLTNLGYDYAGKQTGKQDELFNNLIGALTELKNSTDEANDLAEKQQAVEDARAAFQNAQRQRTVRIFNPVTGQWEWVANAADVQQAQERLMQAERTLADAQFDRAIKNAESSGSLEGLIAGEPVNALFSGADEAQKQAVLSALNAYSGVSGFTPTMGPVSGANSSDSHDTNYYFGNVQIPKDKAESMTLAELAKELGVLGIA